MTDTKLLGYFHGMLGRLVGCGDPVLPVAVERDLDGRFTASVFAVDPTEVHALMADRTADPQVSEVVFALDRWAGPGQGVEYPDLLTVFHWLPRRGWRMAVVQYRVEPRDVKPYDWDNAFWLTACADDLRLMDRATGRLQAAARVARRTRRPRE